MVAVPVPGSKSITNRALVLAAAAQGVTVLQRPLIADDTQGCAAALTALGYDVDAPGGAAEWRIMRPSERPGGHDRLDLHP